MFITRKFLSYFLSSVVAVSGMGLMSFSESAKAASDNECAIWLCLPAGFGEGCGAAHSEFKKRLRKGKSPLPSWGSCSTGGDSEPYRYTRKYKTYTNYGKGKIQENRGSNCPNSGVIYWGSGEWSGVQAICTTTEIYTTTFNDGSGVYIHEEERWGKPLEQTLNKKFKADRHREDRESGSSR